MKTYNAETLPHVDPMMVRRFTYSESEHNSHGRFFGGIWVTDNFGAEEVGLVESRMKYDESVIDCSHRMFEITNFFGMVGVAGSMCCFSARRFRDNWSDAPPYSGPTVLHPPAEKPFLFIGNPIRIFFDGAGSVEVCRNAEHCIRSGMALGY